MKSEMEQFGQDKMDLRKHNGSEYDLVHKLAWHYPKDGECIRYPNTDGKCYGIPLLWAGKDIYEKLETTADLLSNYNPQDNPNAGLGYKVIKTADIDPDNNYTWVKDVGTV